MYGIKLVLNRKTLEVLNVNPFPAFSKDMKK